MWGLWNKLWTRGNQTPQIKSLESWVYEVIGCNIRISSNDRGPTISSKRIHLSSSDMVQNSDTCWPLGGMAKTSITSLSFPNLNIAVDGPNLFRKYNFKFVLFVLSCAALGPLPGSVCVCVWMWMCSRTSCAVELCSHISVYICRGMHTPVHMTTGACICGWAYMCRIGCVNVYCCSIFSFFHGFQSQQKFLLLILWSLFFRSFSFMGFFGSCCWSASLFLWLLVCIVS